MFYLVYSAGHCCGPHCNYVTGVARSRSLLGPWEKRPGPFLEDSAAFRCPGHVGVAGAPGGGLLLAYHAYARGDPANRQFLIAPLRFDAEGWPAVGPAANRAAGADPGALRLRRRPASARAGSGRVGPQPSARTVHGELRLGRGVLGPAGRHGHVQCAHGGHRRAARFAARTRGDGLRRQRDRRGAARRARAGLARR